MKIIVKIAVLAFSALIFLTAATTGCGTNAVRIAFFVYDENDTFISELMQQMSGMVPAEIPTETRYAGNSQVKQNQQIVELAGTGIELFVINAVDRMACGSIAEKCVGSGVDVIFFNREPLMDALKEGNI